VTTSTTSTSSQTTTSTQAEETCIPAAAVISTTAVGTQFTSKIFERVLDVTHLSSLNRKANVTITSLPEFEDAQKVEFTYNGTVVTYYVLVHTTTTTTDVIILNYTSYEILHVYEATQVKNTNVATGFSIDLVNKTATAETTTYVQTFIDT
jgi:hypothetical protein